MAIVTLCQCDLDIAYEHSMTFNNVDEQHNYLKGNVYRTYILNIPVDGDREIFEVDSNINDIIEYDYCIIEDKYGDIYYYFILGMEQKGLMTNVYVQIDLVQTYLFDWKIHDSFVDRGHVERWFNDEEPAQWLEDEGLEYGPLVIEEIEKVTRIPLNFIICATTPIGNIDTSNESGDTGGSTTSGGDWKNGVPSKQMFRFLKGFEGYGPRLYHDSGGVPTIGYGTTKSELTDFNRLVANQPCSEEMCAKIGWNNLIKNYGKKIANAVKNLGCTQQRQFDALVDLAYNGGIDLVINSSGNRDLANTIKKNPNDEATIRKVWENYFIKDNHGTPQAGLVARRKAECNMYFGKKYEIRTIPTLGANGNVNGTFKGDGWLP